MDDKPPPVLHLAHRVIEAFGSQRDMGIYVIEVTELNFEVKSDL